MIDHGETTQTPPPHPPRLLPSTCPPPDVCLSASWFCFSGCRRCDVTHAAGINVLDLGGEKGRAAGCVGTDPLRLTVSFDGGIGGYEADEILIEGGGMHNDIGA